MSRGGRGRGGPSLSRGDETRCGKVAQMELFTARFRPATGLSRRLKVQNSSESGSGVATLDPSHGAGNRIQPDSEAGSNFKLTGHPSVEATVSNGTVTVTVWHGHAGPLPGGGGRAPVTPAPGQWPRPGHGPGSRYLIRVKTHRQRLDRRSRYCCFKYSRHGSIPSHRPLRLGIMLNPGRLRGRALGIH